MVKLYIHGIGHYHPPNVIDNRFLENLDIGVDKQWILDRVGIEERRTVLDLDYIKTTKNQDIRAAAEATQYSNAQTGAFAIESALQQANLKPEQIGLVLSGGCSSDLLTPAESCSVAECVGIKAPCVDLSSACSTFGAQLHFLSMMDPEKTPDYVLLVCLENNTKSIDYSDRKTAVLWGDGSCAVIISLKKLSKAYISYTQLATNPSGWQKVMIPRFGHFKQEGHAVQTFAIKQTLSCFNELMENTDLNQEKLYFIGHQANLSMLQSISQRCGLKDNQHLFNVNYYGNTGGAGAPTVLSQNWESFKPQDQVALIVVGAGLTWSSMKIKFL